MKSTIARRGMIPRPGQTKWRPGLTQDKYKPGLYYFYGLRIYKRPKRNFWYEKASMNWVAFSEGQNIYTDDPELGYKTRTISHLCDVIEFLMSKIWRKIQEIELAKR